MQGLSGREHPSPTLVQMCAPRRPASPRPRAPQEATEQRARKDAASRTQRKSSSAPACSAFPGSAAGGCLPELQVTPRKLETASSERAFPLSQEDATRMPAASHHHSHPDSGPPRPRVGAGAHNARGFCEPLRGDVGPAPKAATNRVLSRRGLRLPLQLTLVLRVSFSPGVFQRFVFSNATHCYAFDISLLADSCKRCIPQPPAFTNLCLCISYFFFDLLHHSELIPLERKSVWYQGKDT